MVPLLWHKRKNDFAFLLNKKTLFNFFKIFQLTIRAITAPWSIKTGHYIIIGDKLNVNQLSKFVHHWKDN